MTVVTLSLFELVEERLIPSKSAEMSRRRRGSSSPDEEAADDTDAAEEDEEEALDEESFLTRSVEDRVIACRVDVED